MTGKMRSAHDPQSDQNALIRARRRDGIAPLAAVGDQHQTRLDDDGLDPPCPPVEPFRQAAREVGYAFLRESRLWAALLRLR